MLHHHGRTGRIGLLGLLLAAWLAATAPAAAQVVTPTDRVTRGVVVRAEPLAGSDPIGALKPDATAPFVADAPGWRAVRLPDGRVGYVSKAWTTVVGDLPGAPAFPAAEPIYRVHIVDVGTGLAMFIEGPDFTLVYDAGSADDSAGGARNRFIAYLRKVRPDLTTIDHVIASHPHEDHLSMMPALLQAYTVRHVWEPGRFFPTCVYRYFLEAVAGSAATYHEVEEGTGVKRIDYGVNCQRAGATVLLARGATIDASPVALGRGARMTFLHRDASEHDDPNGNSLVVRLDLGAVRVLLTGDAEAGERRAPSKPPDLGSTEASLIDCCAPALKADVLIAGHHGSKTSSRTAFLDVVGARVFVISSGPHPYQSVHLPDPEIEKELDGRGDLFRTDLDDIACAQSTAKIGRDRDGKPGGCDNVVITIQGASIEPAYLRLSD